MEKRTLNNWHNNRLLKKEVYLKVSGTLLSNVSKCLVSSLICPISCVPISIHNLSFLHVSYFKVFSILKVATVPLNPFGLLYDIICGRNQSIQLSKTVLLQLVQSSHRAIKRFMSRCWLSNLSPSFDYQVTESYKMGAFNKISFLCVFLSVVIFLGIKGSQTSLQSFKVSKFRKYLCVEGVASIFWDFWWNSHLIVSLNQCGIFYVELCCKKW